MTRSPQVPDSAMPQLFQAADAASLQAQNQYVQGNRLRLGLVCVAAFCGVTSWRVGEDAVDVLGLVAVVAFVLALLVEASLWKSRPDKVWYDARAVAESAKTLAWKYSVCAEPFPSDMENRKAVDVLLERLESVRSEYRHLELVAVDAPMVTSWMESQRNAGWEERRQTYMEARVRDQKSWYASKAQYNKLRSTQWRFALIGLEFLGFGFALIEAVGTDVPVVSPAVAALVGAVVAWVETKQHDSNSRAYSAAVSDLARAEAKLMHVDSESDWAMEVNDAEDAISREHTLWLASRSQ